jgi:tRNA uridine 5-carboxymethylaminomethyl modification enzyme
MFTSRAESRLHLRIDNADERLTPVGRRVGLVTDERWALFQKKQHQKQMLRRLIQSEPSDTTGEGRNSLAVWLKRPEASIQQFRERLSHVLGEPLLREVLTSIETELKYEGYIIQQEKQIQRLKDAERRPIPAGFVFSGLPGLSREIRDKLERVRPINLGQAARIPGVTPAAIAVLDVYLSVASHRQTKTSG